MELNLNIQHLYGLKKTSDPVFQHSSKKSALMPRAQQRTKKMLRQGGASMIGHGGCIIPTVRVWVRRPIEEP